MMRSRVSMVTGPLTRRLLRIVTFSERKLTLLKWNSTSASPSPSPEWWSKLDYSSALGQTRQRRFRNEVRERSRKSQMSVALKTLMGSTLEEEQQQQQQHEFQQQQRAIDEHEQDEGQQESEVRLEGQGQSHGQTEDLVGETGIGISKVPCGGCGAQLQCENKEFPGFMPADRFNRLKPYELKREVCQRCYLLAEHHTALAVTVRPEDYPAILSQIKDEFAMVILLVDLLDFPLCVWPELASIIGTKRPVVLVGNKVDLIPQDSSKYLHHIQKILEETMRNSNINIVRSFLISVETEYGVEQLISNILRDWGNKGHIYIMGCTNVGKSSLFNLFLTSDLCEVQTADLIRRATVSQWPGTTLNLLKFPVLKAFPWRLSRRNFRLRQENPSAIALKKIRQKQTLESNDPLDLVPVGHVGQSFEQETYLAAEQWVDTTKDLFHVRADLRVAPKVRRIGAFNPDHPAHANSTWCFDTPGVFGTNQIQDLLTMEELEMCCPKSVILPRTFMLKDGKSLFVGGLYRFDYGGAGTAEPFLRVTLYSSPLIPVTILDTQKADEIYAKGKWTDVFGVPFDKSRPNGSKDFPPLEPNVVEFVGVGYGTCCGDVVLSAVGWMGVNAPHGKEVKLVVRSPGGKGVFGRRTPFLPLAGRMRGDKMREKPAYAPHSTFRPVLPV